MVIRCAPDMVMRDHRGDRGWTRQGLLVKIVLENRCETLVGTRTDTEGPPTGGFEASLPIPFAQPHHASTGAEALLGMGPRGQNGFDHTGGGFPRFGGPEHEPLGCRSEERRVGKECRL